VNFLSINHVLPAIPESRFHIKNKWFEVWPRWNHQLVLAEAPASANWTSPSKTRFYNILGKEDQTRNWVTGISPSAEKHAQLFSRPTWFNADGFYAG
jgi:hypothetical protein